MLENKLGFQGRQYCKYKETERATSSFVFCVINLKNKLYFLVQIPVLLITPLAKFSVPLGILVKIIIVILININSCVLCKFKSSYFHLQIFLNGLGLDRDPALGKIIG